MTNFFNFKLYTESYADSKIAIDESIANRIPHDYREFLETYIDVIPVQEAGLLFDINGDIVDPLLYTIPFLFMDKNREHTYPENYMVIASADQFESVFMS